MRTLPRIRRLTASPNLKRELHRQGRQAVWLARQIGVSKSQMSYVIAGRRTVSEYDARLITALLGSSLFLLFECSNEQHEGSSEPSSPMEVAS